MIDSHAMVIALPNAGAVGKIKSHKGTAPGQISRDVPMETTGETPLDYCDIAQRNRYAINGSEGSLDFTFRQHNNDENMEIYNEVGSNREK